MRWAWDFLRKSSHELFIWHGVVEPNKKQEDGQIKNKRTIWMLKAKLLLRVGVSIQVIMSGSCHVEIKVFN